MDGSVDVMASKIFGNWMDHGEFLFRYSPLNPMHSRLGLTWLGLAWLGFCAQLLFQRAERAHRQVQGENFSKLYHTSINRLPSPIFPLDSRNEVN